MPDARQDSAGDERRPCVLIADDEPSMRELLSMVLEAEGYTVLSATNGQEAKEIFAERLREVDLVIQDLKMPGMDGIELLRHFKSQVPMVPVVVITAFSTWDSAVEAMRLGAYDYIRKPFDTDTIRLVVHRALERRAVLERAGENLSPTHNGTSAMIGNHPRIQEILQMVQRIAPTDSTVLIQGESGTGKELVARAVHYRSLRKDRTFISVNCSAFTESLLESELFGHVRGAFTGAVEDKQGYFRSASGGTLFLDEVADMSLTTQVKILRVLEERKVIPVGSTKGHPVDVRIIAATNKDMDEEVRSRRFREDLYYRLNVIPIWLPPLRERKDDIPLLAGHFLAKYSRQMQKEVTGLSSRALCTLYGYDWPGNVRELENIVQRHVALCEGSTIDSIGLIPRRVDSSVGRFEECQTGLIPSEGIDLEGRLETFEREHLQEALRMTNGNLTNAAKLLGMSYRSIRYKVKKLKVKKLEPA